MENVHYLKGITGICFLKKQCKFLKSVKKFVTTDMGGREEKKWNLRHFCTQEQIGVFFSEYLQFFSWIQLPHVSQECCVVCFPCQNNDFVFSTVLEFKMSGQIIQMGAYLHSFVFMNAAQGIRNKRMKS